MQDLLGQTFGDLFVIKRTTKKTNNKWYYLCRCVCGNESEVRGYHLLSGASTGCVKCRIRKVADAKRGKTSPLKGREQEHIADLSGQRFGNLMVLRRGGKSKAGEWMYLCRCKCGKEYEVRSPHLRSGSVTQCRGCLGLSQRVENPISGYPADFSVALKTKIRKRDKYICQHCKVQFGIGELDIHHIDHVRENNDPSNLVSLCNTCHYRMHRKDSNDWIPFWQNYMKERFPND